MASLQLKVVIWKNLIIRKRHWFLTIIEILLPILLFLLISYGRSKVPGLSKEEVETVSYNQADYIQDSAFDVSDTSLYYTPDTEFYQDIIKRVQIKYQIYNNNIKGFASDKSLYQYYTQHHNNTVIAIIFNDKDKRNLDYVIRVHDEYFARNIDTSKLYKGLFGFYPGSGTPYTYKGYISLQKALDISFMEKMYGKDLKDNISIQLLEFPYPPHVQDSFINELFMTYLPIITLFSFIFLCPAVLKRVVEEKYTGTKELMKMVGMKSWMLWLGWFIYGIIPLIFSVIVIVLLMKIPMFGAEYPSIEYTDGSVLFVFLLLYCMAATVFCFAISSLFSQPTFAMIAGILIWILTYFVPKYGFGLDETSVRLSRSVDMILNLFPNMALHYGYMTVSLYEQRELGVQWNIHKSSSGGTDDVTMLDVFMMLIFDIIFYMLITVYLDNVNPGKYGVRKSFLYPIYSLKKLFRRQNSLEDLQGAEPLHRDNVEEGRGLEKGIEIHDLVKRYGHNVAVNKLNLDIYQNQITVLLGHNGAGKSTTMSMITGMVNITSGIIKMNGRNIRQNMDEIRKTLGLCPQYNLMFSDLTVGEHLIFFAMLKGKNMKEAEIEMLELLEKLNLLEKKDDMACTLSGGMKRKLCLGMAIIGGSKVLILDEPTSGLDPESRREIWDLLLEWRGNKTILISTHFMEEADVLGDWIAIMADGHLQCHGTPMFLKKLYETGYHLSYTVKDEVTYKEKETINREIRECMPYARFLSCNGKTTVFLLPTNDNLEIACLLEHLEENEERLGIECLSLTLTTLEDVFLKVRTLKDNKSEGSVSSTNTQESCKTTTAENATALIKMRLKALCVKKLQFYQKKYLTYLLPAIFALLIFVLTIYLSGNTTGGYGDNGPLMDMQLSTYKQTTVFYNGSKQNDIIDKMRATYKRIVENTGSTAVEVDDVEQAIVDKGIENIVYYKKHLVVGGEFAYKNYISAIALYNPIAIHSPPISLNLITDTLAKVILGNNYSITTQYWPLETIEAYTTQEFSQVKVRLLWSVLMPIGFLLVIASFLSFPHMEVSNKFAQLQYMCGITPMCYWMINFFIDFALYSVISVAAAVVAVSMAPYVSLQEFGGLLLIFLTYGAASIPYIYLFSRKSSVYAGYAIFIITGIFFGIILSIIVEVLIDSQVDYYINMGHRLKWLFILVLPQVGLSHSLLVFCKKVISNYNMNVMSRTKLISICVENPNPCCAGPSTTQCQAYQNVIPRLLDNIGLMLISCSIFLIINYFCDSYKVRKYFSQVRFKFYYWWNMYFKGNKDEYENLYKQCNEVESESFKIAEKKTKKPKEDSSTKSTETKKSLNAHSVNKTYFGKLIVKNICLNLKEKECLGILGVNGAGKTTTFRMLTREEIVDTGNISLSTKTGPVNIDENEYLKNLGYCPQMDALNFILTGKQILTLIAHLRGVENCDTVVEAFLQLFELKGYENTPCGYYSGGNKRKLCLAVAMMGHPQFVLLDEPTSGVDPSSRRNFWNLIQEFKDHYNLSIVLTSHSMDECEALCNTLKIMKDGKFEEQGKLSTLKQKYGGFNIKFKLNNKISEKLWKNDSGDQVDGMKSFSFRNIEELKNYFLIRNDEVKDAHSGLLHIFVNDKKKRWSDIFKEVQGIKDSSPDLIEDYTISEATLEDVFLTVARSNSDGKALTSRKNKKKKVKVERQTI